jgi:hypothetical protein
MKTNDDARSLTENSSNRNDPIENERDKLLIQPIVRRIELYLNLKELISFRFPVLMYH